MVSVTFCSLYELQTSQRDTLSLISSFMSGKNRTSQTLFLHFSTPKWELRIMFAMSHLRLYGASIQLSLCSPLLSCSFVQLRMEVTWPGFLIANHLKSHLKIKMAACMGLPSFSTEFLKYCFRSIQQGKCASFCTVNI